MKEVVLSDWYDDYEINTNGILQVKDQIKSCTKKLNTMSLTSDAFDMLYKNISKVIHFWTGSILVGKKKDSRYIKAFQMFYIEFLGFLLTCRESDIEELKCLADNMLYRGKLYRYIGHASGYEGRDKKLVPIYDNIYVSWSKSCKSIYLESKFCNYITLISCEVDDPYYGIDITDIDEIARKEDEVVFPTIEETITDIKYIKKAK